MSEKLKELARLRKEAGDKIIENAVEVKKAEIEAMKKKEIEVMREKHRLEREQRLQKIEEIERLKKLELVDAQIKHARKVPRISAPWSDWNQSSKTGGS